MLHMLQHEKIADYMVVVKQVKFNKIKKQMEVNSQSKFSSP